MVPVLQLLLVSWAIGLSESANFLVYCPLYAHSHHKFLANIAETLTLAGHNVTFLAPIIARKYERVKYLEHTKDVVYIQPDEELEKLGELMDSRDFSKFWTIDSTAFSMIPALQLFYRMFHKVYENLKKDLSVLDALKDRKFDAMFYEVFSVNAIPIQQYLGIKTLYPTFSITHNIGLSRTIGEPAFLSTLSSPISSFGDKMTFEERVMNTIYDLSIRILVKKPTMTSYSNPNENIDLEEAESRAPFVFLNSNPYLDFPRPLLTKSVLIGGISVNASAMRQEKLSKEYDEVLSRREKNVLISFGSLMFSKDMPENYKSNIVRVIDSFPDVTFIWKYESEDVSFAGNLKNVYFSKWVPQTALLADSRLSAFITHAGLGSVIELSYMGKPAILIPIFGDQHRNAKMLERHRGAIPLHKRDLGNFEKLQSSVMTILNDKSFMKNAGVLSRQLEKQPISPQELLVKHAAFGAEFGELPALDPHSRHMSFFTFYMIDILLFCLSLLTLSLLILFFGLRFFLRKASRRKQKTH